MAAKRKATKATAATITKVLAAIGAGAVILKGVRYGMAIFGPARAYRVQDLPDISPESREFTERLSCAIDAILYRDTQLAVLKNGDEFYPAELEAIDNAQDSVNLEAYEFEKGEVTREFVRRLAERAREGVKVRLIIDAIGSWKTNRDYFSSLLASGGEVRHFHPLNWSDWPYFDHRTHRKLLIVDGRVGFIGGAGFADHWMRSLDGRPPWRDTVFRVEGGAVLSLNGAFSQNWVAATGEILFGEGQYPRERRAGNKACMVVMSTPGYGATRARVLFQALLGTARSRIRITSPYFLPDRSARQALIRAVRERGVKVQVLTAGAATDHSSVRRLSEALSADLIRAGIEYYEYQPGMIHAKLLTVDGLWTIAGSTNFDYRSFALNDEVNLAVWDRDITGIIEGQFEQDLSRSRRLTVAAMQSDPLSARILADVSWALRREE